MQKLSKRRFMDWLETFNDKGIVGETGNSYKCPLSNFYVHCLGYDDADVNPNLIKVYNNKGHEKIIKTPIWASEFIEIVDDMPKHYVRASDAREIMEVYIV